MLDPHKASGSLLSALRQNILVTTRPSRWFSGACRVGNGATARQKRKASSGEFIFGTPHSATSLSCRLSQNAMKNTDMRNHMHSLRELDRLEAHHDAYPSLNPPRQRQNIRCPKRCDAGKANLLQFPCSSPDVHACMQMCIQRLRCRI